jgi:hypothetical protein
MITLPVLQSQGIDLLYMRVTLHKSFLQLEVIIPSALVLFCGLAFCTSFMQAITRRFCPLEASSTLWCGIQCDLPSVAIPRLRITIAYMLSRLV